MRYFTLSAPPRGAPGSPPDSAVMSGLLPMMAGPSPKALKWGLWGASEQLCGHPGTQAIPAPRPNLDRGNTSKTLVGWSGSSADTPAVIYPSLYYVRGYQEHVPASLMRTNNMPVPAVDVYKAQPGRQPSTAASGTQAMRLAQIAARSWHVGGQRAVPWPPSPQRFG